MTPQHPIMKRLAAKLSRKGEAALRSGHPWIYETSIEKLTDGGNDGDLVIIYDQQKNKFMGLGLLDTASPIRIKVLHHREPISIDENFWQGKLQVALDIRKPLIAEATNAFRWIFGENDYMPGLIIDVYDRVAVMKIYTMAWLPYLYGIESAMHKLYPQLQSIVLRYSRFVAQKIGSDQPTVKGDLLSPVILIEEYGVRFEVNVLQGHKTGYFLDHRHNRYLIQQMSGGKKVLDLFCYTGGFSTHAAVGGASEVTSVDISQPALDHASSNLKCNGFEGRHTSIQGDVFEVLDKLIREQIKFDIVIVDPPAFAKKQSEVDSALKAYNRLAKMASQVVYPQGTLLLASCSNRISDEAFYEASEKGILQANRSFKCIRKTGHDIDHPTTFSELKYLKAAYYRLNG